MSDRQGAALMIVLWIVVALAAVSSGVVLATRSTTGIAANYRARAIGRYAAESGVALAVATLEDGLATAVDPAERRDYLNHLDRALGAHAETTLGDARLALALVDVGSRLDANVADARSLARLFSFFTGSTGAEVAAEAVRAYAAGRPEEGLEAARQLRSVDELFDIPGMPPELARWASGFLTVDGDGTINRATASEPVLAAAAGELRDEPSRILVRSRGWREGHPMTHEIEAVYAVVGSELTLVRWRESDR
ncbi:MAG: hypothetical protein EXR95_07500 [Gemmatimonadetes bacterium]|nr:hypothetical protein [Gemmatimonadota bacterium]